MSDTLEPRVVDKPFVARERRAENAPVPVFSESPAIPSSALPSPEAGG